jgi:hypothetical protein
MVGGAGVLAMQVVENGRVEGGQIVLPEPLHLPDGTEVVVRVEPVEPAEAPPAGAEDFTSLAFFGMWADRQDLVDSTGWVDRERDQWHRRLARG